MSGNGDHICTEKDSIREVRYSVGQLESSVGQLESSVKTLCKSNTEVVSEIKGLTKQIAEHMAENREHTTEIKHLREGNDILFDRQRRLEDDVIPPMREKLTKLDEAPERLTALESWQDKAKGVFIVIPVVCAAISAAAAVIVAVFNFWKDSGGPAP